MRRFTGYLAVLFFSIAAVGASPPPPDRTEKQISPETSINKQSNPKIQTKLTTGRKRDSKPYAIGQASWYGRYFHGRTTASGEPYDMFSLTAAHRALKLGTWVRVTNLRNGKAVIVRINDRGPVPRSRIIDLSFEAATLLDLRARGVENVRLDIVAPETVATVLNLHLLP